MAATHQIFLTPIDYYDNSGQQIDVDAKLKASIAGLSVSGRTITYTKTDGTTGTITTQDSNTTSFTITANATDGIFDLIGTNGTNAVTYALAPYTSRQSTGGRFDTSTTNPSSTTRLNYDGYLYATRLYSGGSQVLTSVPAHTSGTVTTYGAATTSVAGHVKLKTGDLNGQTAADGTAASNAHTHSQYLTSHQSLANYVTLNGTQTITGAKTLSNHIYFNGGAASSSVSNTSQIVMMRGTTQQWALTSNDNMFIVNPSTTSTTGQLVAKLGNHLYMSGADLGTSSYEWKNGYFSGTVTATSFSGNLSGNATSATSATTATTASKLGSSTVGSSANPIYLSAGAPVACSTIALGAGTSGQILKSDGSTVYWADDKDTTYSAATTSAAGLMSAADKTKLNGIATGATVGIALNTSTGPIYLVGSSSSSATSLTTGYMHTGGSIYMNNGALYCGGTVYSNNNALTSVKTGSDTTTSTSNTTATSVLRFGYSSGTLSIWNS